MTKDVNLDQLQKDAVEIFNQGFACSESIIYAIKKNFELEKCTKNAKNNYRNFTKYILF